MVGLAMEDGRRLIRAQADVLFNPPNAKKTNENKRIFYLPLVCEASNKQVSSADGSVLLLLHPTASTTCCHTATWACIFCQRLHRHIIFGHQIRVLRCRAKQYQLSCPSSENANQATILLMEDKLLRRHQEVAMGTPGTVVMQLSNISHLNMAVMAMPQPNQHSRTTVDIRKAHPAAETAAAWAWALAPAGMAATGTPLRCRATKPRIPAASPAVMAARPRRLWRGSSASFSASPSSPFSAPRFTTDRDTRTTNAMQITIRPSTRASSRSTPLIVK